MERWPAVFDGLDRMQLFAGRGLSLALVEMHPVKWLPIVKAW